MSFVTYIESVRARNPQVFAAKRITITVESLTVLLKHAHGAGHAEGVRFREDLGKLAGDGVKDIFAEMFGGKNPFGK
jgi:hypothetical protein